MKKEKHVVFWLVLTALLLLLALGVALLAEGIRLGPGALYASPAVAL